ncbi:MAG: single-stranded-DNA-specific exonuclease RecJ [Nitrospira sp. SB0677_bin_15]|nr:single-stranded-DNA-specific exonuclease RecJ [Nitrospira sp. SB0667_bin_9]MYD31551.1 single-stranded-DNA-specific exonuclease RecJ [Nitrospira sp. SB0661_bin_20]MYG41347.1 single-stranded-DNA-specific exonuclease RecJ [Nitrospira sp. SB0677_bin_15]MYH02712.1 single-stranded-DNA-specific exonuclease RecJ [Nitrospira sp. SB0675_bin_23]
MTMQSSNWRARSPLHWQVRSIAQQQVSALAGALGVSPLAATVLCGRGVVEPEQAKAWLASSGGLTHDPFLLPDVERAIDRLHLAIQRGERICFYGDYDVDGMAATSLHFLFWRSMGAQAEVYIPHRQEEGYGLHEGAIRKLAGRGVSLLLTADCGTTSYKEIELARSLGMDVIVTDHHQLQSRMPEPLAFINPYRPDSAYPFRGLCSGGLAYKVAEAFVQKYRPAGTSVEPYRDLVALSSIADLVPLTDENRTLVRDGLAQVAQGTRCGIRALTRDLGLNGTCSAGTIGFRVAPRLNAAGRLAHAELGVRLLTTESEPVALQLAQELENLNRHRREIEEEMTREAMAQAGDPRPAIVVSAKGWHIGVIGIVAARLVERYHRPAVVVTFDAQGIGKGSVRGVAGFDVCRALQHCEPDLVAFGGHPMAAGLTVREEAFAGFRHRFEEAVEGLLDGAQLVPSVDVDAEVGLAAIQFPLVRELERLEPFGTGNPEPTLMSRGISVLEKRVVGENHLKLVLRQPGSVPLDSIGFRMGSLADTIDEGSGQIDAVFTPELNEWKGSSRIQLRLRDVRVG